MKSIVQFLFKLIMLGCLVVGGALMYKTRDERATAKKKMDLEQNNPKILALKKFLLTFKKPARVEIFNITKRYNKDVDEILEMKIATDPNSDFYVTIHFFTDENDAAAPLVAQIKFLDLKSDNLMKEQSINLN